MRILFNHAEDDAIEVVCALEMRKRRANQVRDLVVEGKGGELVTRGVVAHLWLEDHRQLEVSAFMESDELCGNVASEVNLIGEIVLQSLYVVGVLCFEIVENLGRKDARRHRANQFLRYCRLRRCFGSASRSQTLAPWPCIRIGLWQIAGTAAIHPEIERFGIEEHFRFEQRPLHGLGSFSGCHMLRGVARKEEE